MPTDKNETEIRSFPLRELRVERRDGAPAKLVGYAAIFNELSEDLGGFREKIVPGAFRKAVAEDDIRALFNHNPDHVLGRTKSGTLRLTEDDKGLRMEVDLPDTQVARDLAVSIERGDITGQSFAFRVRPGGQSFDQDKDGKTIRTLSDVALYDVGPVVYPAYLKTEISLRSLQDAGIGAGSHAGAIMLPDGADSMRERLMKIHRSIEAKEKSGKDWVEIRDAGGQAAVEILIYDAIGLYGTEAKEFVQNLGDLKGRNLHIRINSPGGSVMDGAAIYNALKRHDAGVLIDIEGMAASMAGIIAMAGHKVRINKSAFFMVHSSSGCCWGDARMMEDEASLLRKVNSSLCRVLSDRAGKDHGEMLKLMDRESWFDAYEAVEMGFADEVLNEKGATLRHHDLSHFRNVPQKLIEMRKQQARDRDGDMDRLRRRQQLSESE